MSRLGKLPLLIPFPTKVIIKSRLCFMEGPYGSCIQKLPKSIFLNLTSAGLVLNYSGDITKEVSTKQGLLMRLLKNKLIGIHYKFEKNLQLIGVGYRAKLEQDKIYLFIGFSHSTFLVIPKGLMITITNNIFIKILGIDKQLVCLFASKIRQFKVPEPYKGKGIKYINEIIIRKVGKSNKT